MEMFYNSYETFFYYILYDNYNNSLLGLCALDLASSESVLIYIELGKEKKQGNNVQVVNKRRDQRIWASLEDKVARVDNHCYKLGHLHEGEVLSPRHLDPKSGQAIVVIHDHVDKGVGENGPPSVAVHAGS